MKICRKKSANIFKISALWLALMLVNSCTFGFTGGSLNHDEKTIDIKTFPNNAPLVNPNLSQQFSVELQNRFLRTKLKGTKDTPEHPADILVEGEITDYTISPTTISSGVSVPNGTVQAAQNKLMITVKVHYENRKDPKAGFDRTYSDEAVFSSDLDINAIEASQVKIVNDRIINKIFNDIVANW